MDNQPPAPVRHRLTYGVAHTQIANVSDQLI